MKITAQPFGMPLAKERMGKWIGPKIFENEAAMWAYVRGWYIECLELDFFNQEDWHELCADEVPDTIHVITRGFAYRPHIGDDFLKAFLFPHRKGMLIVKSADRLNSQE